MGRAGGGREATRTSRRSPRCAGTTDSPASSVFLLLTRSPLPFRAPRGTGDHQQQRARRARPDHDAARRHGRQHHAAAQHVAQHGQSGRLGGAIYLATTGSSDCVRRLEAALRTRKTGPGASDHRRKRRLSSNAAPNSPFSPRLTMQVARRHRVQRHRHAGLPRGRAGRRHPARHPGRHQTHPHPHPHPSQPPPSGWTF